MRTDEAMTVLDLHSDLMREIERQAAEIAELKKSDASIVGLFNERADIIAGLVVENVRLRTTIQHALDHYDMRSELYTNGDDLAAGMAAILRGVSAT